MMKRLGKNKVAVLAGAGLLAVGTTWLAVGQEGSSMRAFLASTGGSKTTVARNTGQRQTSRSKTKYNNNQNRIRVVQSEPRPSRPKPPADRYTPVTLHVVNAKRVPVTGIPISLAIADHRGQVTRVVRNTDARGNVDLSRVGPLPADVKVFSGSPKWQLANANSARFEVTRPRSAHLPQEEGGSDKPVMLASLRLTQGLLERSADSDTKPDHYVLVKPVQAKLIVKAPPQARVGSPAFAPAPVPEAQDTLVVPESGEVEAELPAEATEEGAVPIVVTQKLPGGTAEAVIESYSTEDEEQTVQAPPLRLASVDTAKIAQDLDLLSNEQTIQKALGKPNKKDGGAQKMNDGSEWWLYNKAGVAFKMRRVALGPDVDKTVNVAERVRLLNANGGRIGNVGVGSSREEVLEQWGEPQVSGDAQRPFVDDLFAKAQIDSYLDGGLRVGYAAGKVAWIDIARMRRQLVEGTTTFVPRSAARLYVKSFRGNSNPHCSIKNVEDFKHFLRQSPAVTVVDSEEDADLTIEAEVLFTEGKTDKYLNIIPAKYSCSTSLRYSVFDNAKGKYVVQGKLVAGNAEVSVKKTLIGGGLAAIVMEKLLGHGSGAATLLGTFIKAKQKIKRATRTCPGISIRKAFNELTQDLSRTADFSARVTSIDYARGLMTLNIGSEQGVRRSTVDQPFEFRIAVADTALGESTSKDGRKVEYYAAVVRSVTPHSSVCEFQHVEGILQGESEDDGKSIPSRPDLKALSRLPDPASGLISAQATVNFPEIEVFSDSELNEMETQLRQRANSEGQQNQE